MKTERRTKARKAYELLFEAANQLRFVDTYDLKKIAQAINPKLERDGELLILDDSHWLDGSLSPGLVTLGREWVSNFGTAKALLVFYREREKAWSTLKVHHDIRLVYSFERGEKLGSCWLDCETGLPWVPRAVLHLRQSMTSAVERGERMDRDAADYKMAARALKEFNHEIAWYYGDTDWGREALYERLEERRRRDYWSEWKTERVIAERFHPAGSNIHDSKQRAEWLRQRALDQEAAA